MKEHYRTCGKCGKRLLFPNEWNKHISQRSEFPTSEKGLNAKREANRRLERRLKISMANKGKPKPIEYRKRMSEIRKVDPKWQSVEAKQNWRDKTIKQHLSFPNTNTSIELLLQESLASHNVTFVTSQPIESICRPDIILLDRKVAIFADGCYWHGCPTHFPNPSPKQRYWINRDNTHNRLLESKGWKVIRVWEHEIVTEPNVAFKKLECQGQEVTVFKVGT